MLFSVASTLALVASAQAAPFLGSSVVIEKRAEGDASNYNKSMHSVTEVQIHSSCNAAQTNYLRNGLDEMVTLARHAHDRILRLGEEDQLYRLYFGNASSATALGLYAQIAYGNKPGVLLRCDDPDQNCATQTTAAGPWAGHWRGSNSSLQTVICSPTYSKRFLLGSLCFDGNMVGEAPAAAWLATDLLHRMMHIPSITYDHIHHAADTYLGCLELAASNSSDAATNQNTFQYYAIDAYARDVAYPPSGCTAANLTAEHDNHSHDASSAPASTSAIAAGGASPTATAAESCHTHADGVVHCS